MTNVRGGAAVNLGQNQFGSLESKLDLRPSASVLKFSMSKDAFEVRGRHGRPMEIILRNRGDATSGPLSLSCRLHPVAQHRPTFFANTRAALNSTSSLERLAAAVRQDAGAPLSLLEIGSSTWETQDNWDHDLEPIGPGGQAPARLPPGLLRGLVVAGLFHRSAIDLHCVVALDHPEQEPTVARVRFDPPFGEVGAGGDTVWQMKVQQRLARTVQEQRADRRSDHVLGRFAKEVAARRTPRSVDNRRLG